MSVKIQQDEESSYTRCRRVAKVNTGGGPLPELKFVRVVW